MQYKLLDIEIEMKKRNRFLNSLNSFPSDLMDSEVFQNLVMTSHRFLIPIFSNLLLINYLCKRRETLKKSEFIV